MRYIKFSIAVFAASVACSFSASAQPTSDALQGLSVAPVKETPAPACTPPAPKDPALWDKSIRTGVYYAEGNANVTTINANGKIARDFEDNSWRFEADYNYGSASEGANESKEENQNSLRGVADYKHILDTTWFLGANTSYFRDEVADLDYRVIVNPGVGAFLLRDDQSKLSFEVGPSYVWEEKAGESDDYLAPRLADRLDWKFSDTAKIFQYAEYLFSVEDTSNYLVSAELGVEVALNSSLSLVLSVRDNYVNQPAEDRTRNDVATITALKVTL